MRAAIVAFLMVAGSYSRADTFYVQDGDVLSRVDNADPDKIVATEWQIRLYRNGAPQTRKEEWGMITSSTREGAERQLAWARRAEQAWERFTGRSDVLTYFNSLGPIAVLKKRSLSERALALADSAAKLGRRIRKIDQLGDALFGIKNLPPWGSSIIGHIERIRHIDEEINRIENAIRDASGDALDDITRDLERASEDLAKAERDAQRLAQDPRLREIAGPVPPVDIGDDGVFEPRLDAVRDDRTVNVDTASASKSSRSRPSTPKTGAGSPSESPTTPDTPCENGLSKGHGTAQLAWDGDDCASSTKSVLPESPTGRHSESAEKSSTVPSSSNSSSSQGSTPHAKEGAFAHGRAVCTEGGFAHDCEQNPAPSERSSDVQRPEAKATVTSVDKLPPLEKGRVVSAERGLSSECIVYSFAGYEKCIGESVGGFGRVQLQTVENLPWFDGLHTESADEPYGGHSWGRATVHNFARSPDSNQPQRPQPPRPEPPRPPVQPHIAPPTAPQKPPEPARAQQQPLRTLGSCDAFRKQHGSQRKDPQDLDHYCQSSNGPSSVCLAFQVEPGWWEQVSQAGGIRCMATPWYDTNLSDADKNERIRGCCMRAAP